MAVHWYMCTLVQENLRSRKKKGERGDYFLFSPLQKTKERAGNQLRGNRGLSSAAGH